MLASSVRTFNDPIDYGGAIQGAATEIVALGRGRFSAKLTRIKLQRLWGLHDLPCRINAVDLKHRLRDIQPDCHNLRHDLLLSPPNRLYRP
jgi:hypothetical protein